MTLSSVALGLLFAGVGFMLMDVLARSVGDLTQATIDDTSGRRQLSRSVKISGLLAAAAFFAAGAVLF